MQINFYKIFYKKNNGIKQIKIDYSKNDKQNENNSTFQISNKLSWLLGIFFTTAPIAVGIALGAIGMLV